MRVAFVHPDLGLGGAEQLVVHAACGLQKKGHSVVIYTAHHDPNHCFTPTRDGRVYDVIINDQLAALNPLLKRITQRVVYYCHFPDLLLCTDRSSLVKRLYRWPLDRLEEWSTGCADVVLANSQFTVDVFQQTFPSLSRWLPVVLYPPVDLTIVDAFLAQAAQGKEDKLEDIQGCPFDQRATYFLSLNRYERKKNIARALEAFAMLKQQGGIGAEQARLVIAGGYDIRVAENRQYEKELRRRRDELGIAEDQVCFLKSVTDGARWSLLYHATALIYTPTQEHFGMVPCEAMAVGTVVIASNSGGPRETVIDGQTGFLCEDDSSSFATAMQRVLDSKTRQPQVYQGWCQAAKSRVREAYSLEAFADQLEDIVDTPRKQA
ncbi:unnamed protein product [Vitrella brassicaformis CCMP3155]|uniref:Alpha-1,3/1,6-mannosyltransferase ALG2 n=1 Tax=Vitrella brassicaformis (strain CCMP3155) TaxID=1169540 RepID=A0A0G4EI41_VITBC|nr:unnamed protein product [Vitrella brassicaformis CCMP3155]|eukprot:CEL96655.1 unnamed protein product [Vitrella brassicaformis CCMP3155]